MSLATTGVNATVGGNLTGERALCAAYAMAKVPTLSLVSDGLSPNLERRAGTSTPTNKPELLQMARGQQQHQCLLNSDARRPWNNAGCFKALQCGLPWKLTRSSA